MSKKVTIKTPEIQVSFDRGSYIDFPQKITQSSVAAKLMRSLFEKGEIELHEVFLAVFLDRANQPIGYYRHSIGGISGTVVDTRILLGTALKTLASGMLICHNHPSGNIFPSQADKNLTKKLADGTKSLDIALLDHTSLG